MTTAKPSKDMLEDLLESEAPTCVIIKAKLKPVAGLDRFQPAGFPEVGHILYDTPNGNGKVCIVDSPASMANHLEAICLAGTNEAELHDDLAGLPYVVCVTDNEQRDDGRTAESDPDIRHDKKVCTSLTEGHRIASDYFLDGLINPKRVEEPRVSKKKSGKENTIPTHWVWKTFRAQLREAFRIVEVKKDKTYFIHPENWWTIYQTIFRYDPNSLVHGVMFAKEQIKISRLLTAHLEAFGASRVGRSGVKFDRLGKTVSGQPIFAVDEETAREIRATFVLDLALLRSYGRTKKLPDEQEKTTGLNHAQKKFLLGFALWKIKQILARPFRFRTQCHLQCAEVEVSYEGEGAKAAGEERPAGLPGAAKGEEENQNGKVQFPPLLGTLNIKELIGACNFGADCVTSVYYPINELFKPGKDEEEATDETADESAEQGITED